MIHTLAKHYKLNIAVILVIFVTMFCPVMVLADNPVTVELPMTLKITGEDVPDTETFTFVLEAVTKDAPMPAGSSDGKFTMVLGGAESVTFPEITYDEVGEYEYRIYQEEGDNPDFSYDTDAYLVKVGVLNEDNMVDKKAVILYTIEGSKEKNSSPMFANGYSRKEPTATPTISPTATPTSKKTDKLGKPTKVRTGDDSPVLIWLCIMEGAAIIILLILTLRTKREQQVK